MCIHFLPAIGENCFGNTGRVQWLIPVIPATQEVEIRRITTQARLGKYVRLYLKK
jgi:hypothetical protein